MARRKSHTEPWWEKAPPHIIRCTAHYKSSGEQCKSEAAPGTNVCDKHGALAPAVQAAAATRIQMSVDDAAKQLVAWMNDASVDMRERVKIAHDLLDRGGLGATSKHLVGVVQQDPVEQLFQSILTAPGALADPDAPAPAPDPVLLELNRKADADDPDWGDVVDAELVEDVPAPVRTPTRAPAPAEARRPYKTPKHIREALEKLL